MFYLEVLSIYTKYFYSEISKVLHRQFYSIAYWFNKLISI